ncbi:hypothetical protein C8R45DRAFT_962009 [Mycena sanguinolenta]|nr:hypothetical protein C8R45DRAFT_962009 [Mycena sanguinolenta]
MAAPPPILICFPTLFRARTSALCLGSLARPRCFQLVQPTSLEATLAYALIDLPSFFIWFVGPNTSISDAALLAFVKARMAMPTPLQQIQVQFHRPKQLDLMRELEPLISDRLKVDIEYPPSQRKFKPRKGLASKHLS